MADNLFEVKNEEYEGEPNISFLEQERLGMMHEYVRVKHDVDGKVIDSTGRIESIRDDGKGDFLYEVKVGEETVFTTQDEIQVLNE